jgi:hypothetical protein
VLRSTTLHIIVSFSLPGPKEGDGTTRRAATGLTLFLLLTFLFSCFGSISYFLPMFTFDGRGDLIDRHFF